MFSPQEQDIIKYGLQNGKTYEDVKGAITNYRLGVKPAKPAQAPAPSPDAPGLTAIKESASGLGELYGGGQNGIANKLKQDVQAGAADIQQGNVAKGIVKAGVRTAGDVAGTVYAPLGAVVGAGMKITGAQDAIDWVGKQIADKTGISDNAAFQKWAMNHPNAAEDFGRVLNISLAATDSSKIEPSTMVERTIDQAKGLTNPTYYHGANSETAASIKNEGFKGSQDFPGNGMVSLSPDESGASNYANLDGKGGEVLKVKVNGTNVKTYPSMEAYTNAIENAPGTSAGAKEMALNAPYDKVIVKNTGGTDLILAKPSAIEMVKEGQGIAGKIAEGVGALEQKFKDTVSPPKKSPLDTAIEDATPNYENASKGERTKLMGRVEEGGTLKGRTVKPTPLETEAGTELSKVPGYDPKATKLAKYQTALTEVQKRGAQLEVDVGNEKVIVPKKQIAKIVSNAINEVPDTSLLLQKSDPVIGNYMRVVENSLKQEPGNLQGVLRLRKTLDAAYENARGKQAYGSDKIAALDDIHKAGRDALTQYLIDNAKNVDVKASLRSQWNLYRAIDELGVAAEQEAGSTIGRLMQQNPITTKAAQVLLRGTAAGSALRIVK